MGWWIYDSEEEAKDAVKDLNNDNPSKFKYTYRLMTMDETYRYLGH